MSTTFEVSVASVSRFRVAYSCWLLISLFFLFLEIYFITFFLNRIPAEHVSQSDTFSRITLTLLFVDMVFETCFLLSGAGAVISMAADGLQLHYVFTCMSLPLTVIISLVAIWTNVTRVIVSFIALFASKVAAFALLFVIKNAIIIEPQVSFYIE